MNSDGIQLRDARPGDRETILAVTLSAYEQYAVQMGKVWEFYRASILAMLADVRSAVQIVADARNEIVGTVILLPGGTEFHLPDGSLVTLPVPEIRLLAVAPKSRGQGIGAALTQECIRRVRASGGAAITLHTTDMMSVAMRMYERMGFVRDSATDFHPAEGIVVKGYRYDLVPQPGDGLGERIAE